ncbi:hypothetical protein E2C01_022305 [Portunus trituberculatus]|uniref:Uncharacterized protein n=1 Tax=Portunus trituberculatus TaxID=210409 RepID=A0A5B7E5M8_PORTR|nr:hypothetical protein [Portunus trituberculatus]
MEISTTTATTTLTATTTSTSLRHLPVPPSHAGCFTLQIAHESLPPYHDHIFLIVPHPLYSQCSFPPPPRLMLLPYTLLAPTVRPSYLLVPLHSPPGPATITAAIIHPVRHIYHRPVRLFVL